MPHRLRRITLALATAVITAALLAPPVLGVANRYAGWAGPVDKLGIRGYILQPATGTSITGEAVISWIGLCADMCSPQPIVGGGGNTYYQWVQLGMYQGEFAAGSSPTSVHVYYENVDPCNVYWKDDLGIPYSNPHWFRVMYDDLGQRNYTCPNGVPYTGYRFGYKKGHVPTADPFVYGVMSVTGGRADANVELHETPVIPTVYFGCASTATCLSDYGIEMKGSGGNWHLCCDSPLSIGPANPPYRKTINNYYSFKVCPTLALCS